MDKATLVDKDLRIGNDIIGLLTAADIPVDDAFWAYVPQVEEWRLVLSSPKVKMVGVRNSYLAMSNALHKSPLLDEIPLRRISLLSPDDDLVRTLKDLDRYPYEGALHIVRVQRPHKSPMFHVTFAPYKGPGGAVPAVALDDEPELERFLQKQVGIKSPEIQAALRELNIRGSHSFPNVQMTTAELRRTGLLHPSQKVYPQRVDRKQ